MKKDNTSKAFTLWGWIVLVGGIIGAVEAFQAGVFSGILVLVFTALVSYMFFGLAKGK